MSEQRESEQAVKALYEAYPYPPKRGDDPSADLALGCLDSLARIDHWLWSGRRDFTKPFSVLVAGGGTGDATVRLARQLTRLGGPFRLVHLDLSVASIAVAESRLARHGLSGAASFVQGSLLDLATLDGLGGPFDYINCSGVLHHLDSPDDGLRALASALAEDGGIGLMLYGELGRTGIYDIQEILRRATAGLPEAIRVTLARKLLAELPPTNRLKTNPLSYGGDPLTLPDADIADLFLHPRDRAYRVPDIHALLDGAAMELAAFLPGWLYRPEWSAADPLLRAQYRLLPARQAQAVAELLVGAVPTHSFFARRSGRPAPPHPVEDDDVPIPARRSLAQAIADDGSVVLAFGAVERPLSLPALAKPLLAAMDGARTLAEVKSAVPGAPDEIDAALVALLAVMEGADLLWRVKGLRADYADDDAPPMLLSARGR